MSDQPSTTNYHIHHVELILPFRLCEQVQQTTPAFLPGHRPGFTHVCRQGHLGNQSVAVYHFLNRESFTDLLTAVFGSVFGAGSAFQANAMPVVSSVQTGGVYFILGTTFFGTSRLVHPPLGLNPRLIGRSEGVPRLARFTRLGSDSRPRAAVPRAEREAAGQAT
jgi:hypothetical protein